VIGRSLGDFVLREKLADGGFGEIYRAEQPRLAREAVVKVLRARLEARDAVRVAFVREVQLASRLDHPFAAHVYDCRVEADGLLWIAMELVRGTPLSVYLGQHGRFTPEALAPLLDRICQVVQTAHQSGIVHRDIKPSNVMVIERAGELLPKLLDFGIARAPWRSWRRRRHRAGGRTGARRRRRRYAHPVADARRGHGGLAPVHGARAVAGRQRGGPGDRPLRARRARLRVPDRPAAVHRLH
jgi:serine/threonine protein kinase